MPYLVDGNNLAHAMGFRVAGLADREACARIVGAFCQSRGAQATLVFDGPAPEGSKASGETHRLRVIFSEGRSADDVILRLLTASKTPRDFVVVTSDKSLGDRARHQGAAVERAHEFARRLDRSPRTPPAGPEKPSRRESPDEIEAWLELFARGRKSEGRKGPGSR